MSREAFEEKYAQSWADTPPHVRRLWLEAWQAATSAQEARVKELEEAIQAIANPIPYLQRQAVLEGGILNCTIAAELSKDAAFLKSIAKQALSATAREDV